MSDKIYGPYTRKDGRKHIIVVGDYGIKTTVSYSKYLLEIKLGRKLIGNETCDHIDGNHTNDNLDNLQVLSRKDNATKSALLADHVRLVCKNCKIEFFRRGAVHRHNISKGKDGPFCSHRCVGEVHH